MRVNSFESDRIYVESLETKLQNERRKTHKVRMKLHEIIKLLGNSDLKAIDRVANALVWAEEAVERIDA